MTTAYGDLTYEQQKDLAKSKGYWLTRVPDEVVEGKFYLHLYRNEVQLGTWSEGDQNLTRKLREWLPDVSGELL